jgi:hypothetical protein
MSDGQFGRRRGSGDGGVPVRCILSLLSHVRPRRVQARSPLRWQTRDAGTVIFFLRERRHGRN